MTVFLSPVGGAGAQFFDNNGNPLTGGKLYTYDAGTTTPRITYTSFTGLTPHTNPIVLDAAGRVPGSSEIWVSAGANYKFVLKDGNDVLIATWDNLLGLAAGSSTIENFAGTGAQTVFTLTRAPVNENSTNVYINGVHQQKNTYTVLNNAVTFSEAPPLTSTIEVSYF